MRFSYHEAPKEFVQQISLSNFIDGLKNVELALRFGRHNELIEAIIHGLLFEAVSDSAKRGQCVIDAMRDLLRNHDRPKWFNFVKNWRYQKASFRNTMARYQRKDAIQKLSIVKKQDISRGITR